MRDLAILVADKNAEAAVRGAIVRHQALGIRVITYRLLVEAGRDGGVRKRGAQVLRAERSVCSHAVLMFDYEGCGSDQPAEELEAELDALLQTEWGSHAKAIVIEPEVDLWMWGAEVHLRQLVEWEEQQSIRQWLEGHDFAFNAGGKPLRPKEALEAIFRKSQMSRSSSYYEALSGRLSLAQCQDPSFQRLRGKLIEWFGVAANG